MLVTVVVVSVVVTLVVVLVAVVLALVIPVAGVVIGSDNTVATCIAPWRAGPGVLEKVTRVRVRGWPPPGSRVFREPNGLGRILVERKVARASSGRRPGCPGSRGPSLGAGWGSVVPRIPRRLRTAHHSSVSCRRRVARPSSHACRISTAAA